MTDVLFYGGITNDRSISKKNVYTAIRKLAEVTRKKYPNARILYAIGNWHANPTRKNQYDVDTKRYQRRVLNRIGWYKEACQENGIYYLSDVDTALRKKNNSKYFGPDGHHPSKEGVERLASVIAESISYLNHSTKIRSISLKRSTCSLKVNQSIRLKYKLKARKKCVTKKVVFVSDNPSVCSVNSSTGLVKAKSPGSCQIYCKAFDGSGKYDVCKVTVQQ